jgi:hypothetical protein
MLNLVAQTKMHLLNILSEKYLDLKRRSAKINKRIKKIRVYNK